MPLPESSRVEPGSPLPDPLPDFLQAAGALAATAVERGDRAEARRLLEDALRAVDAGPRLRALA